MAAHFLSGIFRKITGDFTGDFTATSNDSARITEEVSKWKSSNRLERMKKFCHKSLKTRLKKINSDDDGAVPISSDRRPVRLEASCETISQNRMIKKIHEGLQLEFHNKPLATGGPASHLTKATLQFGEALERVSQL